MDIVDKKVNKILIIIGILFTVLSFISEINRVVNGEQIHYFGIDFSNFRLVLILFIIYFFIVSIKNKDREFLVLNGDKISDNLRDIVLYGLLFLGVFVKSSYFLPTKKTVTLIPKINLANFQLVDILKIILLITIFYFFIVIVKRFLDKYIHNKFVVILLVSFIYTMFSTTKTKVFPEYYLVYFLYVFFQKIVITSIVYRSKHIYYGFIFDTFL